MSTERPPHEECGLSEEEYDKTMLEAHQEREAYIKKGVCSQCGATSLKDAEGKCTAMQYPSGEYMCAGDELWEDQHD